MESKLKKIITTITSCVVLLAVSLNSVAMAASEIAEISETSITTKLSTMGLGLEYEHPVNPKLSLDFGVNKFSTSKTVSEDEIDYNANIDLQNLSMIANYSPWENSLQIRLGAYYNNNTTSLDASYVATSDDAVGESVFTGATIGLDGELSFRKFAPYIGIGYGSQPIAIGNTNFSFDFDIGVIHSPTEVQLSGTCSVGGVKNAGICTGNNFDAALAKERSDLTSALKVKFFPVISAGLTYRF